MYKMPKNNEEQKKCIPGKTWVGKDSKGKERILIEDKEWNEKCMRAFVKRSKDFCEPMDDEDRLSKRIKNSANNKFTVRVRKNALTHILKATRNALVVEKNAEFHCKFSTTSDRFKTEYKKAFEKKYSSTEKTVSLEVVEDDYIMTPQNAECSCLLACAASAKKVNSLAPFEGLLHEDHDGYECCVYAEMFTNTEVEKLLKGGLNAPDAKSEKVRNEYGTEDDFKSNRLQAPLKDEESKQLQKKLHFSLVFLFYEYGFFLLLANWGNRSVNGNTPMILAIFIFFTTNLCVFAPKPVCLRGTIFPVSETKRVDSIFASFQSIDRATSASKSFPFLSTLRVFWLADGAADANEPSSSLGSYVWPG